MSIYLENFSMDFKPKLHNVSALFVEWEEVWMEVMEDIEFYPSQNMLLENNADKVLINDGNLS